MAGKTHNPEELFGCVESFAREQGVRDIEALITGGGHELTRFANNTIHQNVAEQSRHLSVRAVIDGRTARASTNRLDRDGVRDAVSQAIALTRLTAPDPELPEMAGPQEYRRQDRCFEATAHATPEERALAVAEAIRVVEDAGQTAAGTYSTGHSTMALMNSRGVSVSYSETQARFSITAMAADSSGWAKASACYHGDLDPVRLAMRASRKASRSRAPRELPPGKYTVILEPAAVLDLVGQMFGDFSATAAAPTDAVSWQRPHRPEALWRETSRITRRCVYHPAAIGGPAFDGEGVPRRPLTLVEGGVVREVAYSRAAAA